MLVVTPVASDFMTLIDDVSDQRRVLASGRPDREKCAMDVSF
jgi:hypothetical protein